MNKKHPEVSPITFYCQDCSRWSKHYMPRVEIQNKETIKQWCQDCSKVTDWKQEKM